MSKVKIQGNASGTGVLTVTAPNTSTDRTITLPDSTGTLLASEGAVVVNESGADVDFRVESDNLTHALFVQGSTGEVGIRTNSPTAGYSLHVGPASGVHTKVKIEATTATGQAELDLSADPAGVSYLNLGDENSYNIGRIGYFHSDDSMRFRTNGSERMRILSGGGLTFNGDTAAANALDDYEEGTWTPVLGGVSTDPTSVTYPVRVGTYTKIGNMVHASFYLEITAHSGGVGDALIKGLPYVVSNYTGYDYAGGFAKSQIYSQGSYSGGRNTFTISARKNNSYLMFRQYGGTTSVGMTGWGLSQMTGNLYVGGVYTYPVF